MNGKRLVIVLLVLALLFVARFAYIDSGQADDALGGSWSEDAITEDSTLEDDVSRSKLDDVVSVDGATEVPTSSADQNALDTSAASLEPAPTGEGGTSDSQDDKYAWPSRIPDFADSTKYSRVNYYDVPSASAFGSDCSNLRGDKVAAIHSLYEICYDQPETLASTVSAFPSLLAQCGVTTHDPVEIDYMLEAEYGAALQQKLLETLDEFLDDPRLDVGFSTMKEDVWMLYMYTRDPKQSSSPTNIGLFWAPVPADSSPQLVITYHGENGDEVGRFDLQTKFQRNVPRDTELDEQLVE